MRKSLFAPIVVFACLLGGCTEVKKATGMDDYSSATRANFISACNATSGGAAGTCECVLDEIEKDMDETEFLSLEQQYARTGVMPPAFLVAVNNCE